MWNENYSLPLVTFATVAGSYNLEMIPFQGTRSGAYINDELFRELYPLQSGMDTEYLTQEMMNDLELVMIPFGETVYGTLNVCPSSDIDPVMIEVPVEVIGRYNLVYGLGSLVQFRVPGKDLMERMTKMDPKYGIADAIKKLIVSGNDTEYGISRP